MKKIDKLLGVGIGTLFLSFVLAAMSDWSHAQELVWPDKGTYIEMRRVHITSDVAARVWPDTQKMVDSVCTVEGGNVRIGTHTAWSPSITHPNIQVGSLILASGTVSLNGSFRGGNAYATGDIGQSTFTLRCLDFLVR